MRLINRCLRLSVCVATAVTIAPSIGAQRPRLPTREISQVADEVLRAVLPPELVLGGESVERRHIAFDLKRTLSAFGAPAADSTVRLKRQFSVGSKSLLTDCSQLEQRQCAHLGTRAYVWIEPLSIARSDAVVRMYVVFADRRLSRSATGAAGSGKGFLTGFATKVRLVRDSRGQWTFVREEESATG